MPLVGRRCGIVRSHVWWPMPLLCAVLVGGLLGGWALEGEPAPAQAAVSPAGAQEFVVVPSESQVVYRVGETLIRESNRFNVAVGMTGAVRGTVTIDRANPRASRISPITVDISQFQSDSARRDNAIRQQWLESARFPTAEFTPTQIEGLPSQYVDGRPLALRITGTLRVRTVSKPTTFDATLTLAGQQLSGRATTRIQMTDFGFDPPAIFGILRAQNEVALEFRFIARPAPAP